VNCICTVKSGTAETHGYGVICKKAKTLIHQTSHYTSKTHTSKTLSSSTVCSTLQLSKWRKPPKSVSASSAAPELRAKSPAPSRSRLMPPCMPSGAAPSTRPASLPPPTASPPARRCTVPTRPSSTTPRWTPCTCRSRPACTCAGPCSPPARRSTCCLRSQLLLMLLSLMR